MIPNRMPKTVVDVFESIDINEEYRWLFCSSPGILYGIFNVIDHEYAIRKTGQ